jgi:hypothetical protein
MKMMRITGVLLFAIGAIVAAQQPDGLQFVVPFLCNGGNV